MSANSQILSLAAAKPYPKPSPAKLAALMCGTPNSVYRMFAANPWLDASRRSVSSETGSALATLIAVAKAVTMLTRIAVARRPRVMNPSYRTAPEKEVGEIPELPLVHREHRARPSDRDLAGKLRFRPGHGIPRVGVGMQVGEHQQPRVALGRRPPGV